MYASMALFLVQNGCPILYKTLNKSTYISEGIKEILYKKHCHVQISSRKNNRSSTHRNSNYDTA